MKTNKLLWSLLISIIAISCSTDDHIIDESLNSESIKSLNFQKNNGMVTSTHGIYGMPEIGDHEVIPGRSIEIAFYTSDEVERYNIRRQFSEQYPTLFLEKPSQSDMDSEIWLLEDKDKDQDSRTDGQPNGAEEPDINNEADYPITLGGNGQIGTAPESNPESSYTTIYESLIQDIRDHESIDLLEEYDTVYLLTGIPAGTGETSSQK